MLEEGWRIKNKLITVLANAYLRWVGATSRIVWINRSLREDLEADKKGFIYAFWHGRQVFLAYLHRGDRIRPLISKSSDGEIIATVCQSFGLEAVRGSSSRGGGEALLKLREEIESGARIGITPDGPRGPLHKVQSGVICLAQITGSPIVPVAFGAKKKWVFKGWDEYVVPKPFNRIAMVYGEPLYVRPEDSLEEKAADLKRALDFVASESDRIAEGECEPASRQDAVKPRWAYPLFNAVLVLSLPLVALAVVLRWRRRVWAHGMERWPERWGHLSPSAIAAFAQPGRWWWVHAVSLGEVKAIEPFIRRAPGTAGVKVLLTALTPEALDWASDQGMAEMVIAAPFDLPWVVRRVIRAVRPELLISVESEFWPNLLREARRAGTRVALINGRISARSFKSYARIRGLTGALFDTVDLFAVRHREDAERFIALGVDPGKIHVTGNLKYDLYVERKSQASWDSRRQVVVVGSAREGEESRLLPALESVRAELPDIRVIWAPRHLQQLPEMEKLLKARGVGYRRLSQLRNSSNGSPTAAPYVLWDSMGNLLEAYSQGDVAVIGGSFVPMGGQNPVEPAALRLPVLFGPSMENFQGVAEHLVRSGGAQRVTLEDLGEHLGELLKSPEKREAMGERAQQAVEEQRGATDRTLSLLKYLVHA